MLTYFAHNLVTDSFMLTGFGEILARDWLGPFFGFTSHRVSPNTTNTSTTSRFSTSGLGLRNAGAQRGGAQDVPGHPLAKSAAETVVEGAVNASTGGTP